MYVSGLLIRVAVSIDPGLHPRVGATRPAGWRPWFTPLVKRSVVLRAFTHKQTNKQTNRRVWIFKRPAEYSKALRGVEIALFPNDNEAE